MDSEPVGDNDLMPVLRLAFGHSVAAVPIPVAPGQSERGMAFALRGHRVPPRVILLRYPPSEQVRALRAFTAMQALHDRNFPVPDVYYLGWSYHTRYVLLLTQLVEGRTDGGQPQLFFARVGPDFAQTLARLHQLTWKTPPDLPVTPLRFALDELTVAVNRLETWHLHQILDWLWSQVGRVQEGRYTVTHGDYTLQNVIGEGTQIAAVQGWEYAVIADPRLDVGYASAKLGAYGVELSDQFLEAYCAAAGPVADSAFWEVLGALRLLVRVARTLSTLHAPQREHFLNQVGPAWNGLLAFVEARIRLQLA